MGHQISRHQIVQYSKVLKSVDGEVIRAQGNGRYYDGQATGGGQVSKAQGVDGQTNENGEVARAQVMGGCHDGQAIRVGEFARGQGVNKCYDGQATRGDRVAGALRGSKGESVDYSTGYILKANFQKLQK